MSPSAGTSARWWSLTHADGQLMPSGARLEDIRLHPGSIVRRSERREHRVEPCRPIDPDRLKTIRHTHAHCVSLAADQCRQIWRGTYAPSGSHRRRLVCIEPERSTPHHDRDYMGPKKAGRWLRPHPPRVRFEPADRPGALPALEGEVTLDLSTRRADLQELHFGASREAQAK